MWHALLMAATEPAQPVSPDTARRWALLLMLVALLGVGLLVVVAAAWVLRRGRRMREAARDQKPTQVTDAWAEAGRRARGDLLAGDPGEPHGGPLEPPDWPIEPDEGRA